MNDELLNEPAPGDEDPALHRLLTSLPRYAPSAGFEERVLARVWRPEPAWVTRVQLFIRSAFKREHAWEWAGGLAACSAFSFVVFASVAAANWMQIETAWSLLVSNVLVDGWRVAVGASVEFVLWAQSVADALKLTGPGLLAVGIGGAGVVAGSAWGLRRTIRDFGGERVSFDATH